MPKFLSETTVAIILLVLLVCFINPFHIWMPTTLHMILLAIIIAAFSLYAMFIWKERIADEREQLHRYISARYGYVIGGAILLLGITVQALQHNIDPWLPFSLGAMVLAKIAGRLWADKKH